MDLAYSFWFGLIFYFEAQLSPRTSEEGTGGKDESVRPMTEKKTLEKNNSFFFFIPSSATRT